MIVARNLIGILLTNLVSHWLNFDGDNLTISETKCMNKMKDEDKKLNLR